MDILGLVCGLALFLYGMDAMGAGLKKSAGGKLKTILGKLTASKFKGFLLGLGVTAIIQSSSATTVMVVGFVNSGTMLLSQAISVIMGANVGTAVTAWLTALNGIEGGADATAFLSYLKPDSWMPILALIGMCLIMFAKRDKSKNVGTILMGFAILMVGMTLMSDAVSGLKNNEDFTQILLLFKNPILGVLAGTALTAIVQSSSASIGILQALSVTGAISYATAIPIILGQNIGTCVTAMISSISANKNGKRTAVAHLYFNVIGVAFWLLMYYLVGWIFGMTGLIDIFEIANGNTINMWGIAAVHTIFKLLAVGLMWPFTKLLEKLANATIKGSDKKGDEYTAMLDERLLETPSVAIENARIVACKMSEISIGSFRKSIGLFEKYDSRLMDEIRNEEDKVDIYEDELGSYLVKISAKPLPESDSADVTKFLHMIGDFERISDHAVNIIESVEEMRDKNVAFSEYGRADLKVMCDAVNEIIQITEEAFVNSDFQKASLVEPLEQVVDELRDQIKLRHTIRLQKSLCSIEHGFILADILTNLERVSDHCSNIAGCLIEMSKNEKLDIHSYLHDIKEADEAFAENHKMYAEKYALSTVFMDQQ